MNCRPKPYARPCLAPKVTPQTLHMEASHVDTTTTPLMTIGRFSKASRLSLKALRLYDALGLLPPAKVDEETCFRYYQESQLASARLIAMLRRLRHAAQRDR